MTWDMRMRNNMFRRLPVERATGRLYGGRHRLRVVYRTRDLVVLGLGVMIGSGIFKIAGEQAASTAGPGVLISFLIAGGVCLLVALAFAELSSIIPVAGSAYSFSYVAFGEVWAWIVGWALVMELLLATSVLARVWSLYATQALNGFDVPIPGWLGDLIGQQRGPDLFALLILLLIVLMLATGSRLSLKTLWYMVLAKVIVIGLVIATGLKFFSPGNLTPFLPPARPAPEGDHTVLDALLGAVGGGTPHVFGVWGVLAAAPTIAFAYVGFDLIATASEETEDAPRKVPRGIITALLAAVVLYAAVAFALVGMVGTSGFARLNPDKLLIAAAFDSVGAGAMGKLVDVGVVLALTTVILVLLISLTRVIFSMSRDGLLPRPLASMSRYKVPSRATLLAGGAAVAMSQTVDVLTLEQLVVIGALFAFLSVPASVLALRRIQPDLHRPFRVPAAPFTAAVTILAVGWLMVNLKVQTWVYFGIWMALGLALYMVYGRRKSQMKLLLDEPPPERPVAARLAAPPPGGGPLSAQSPPGAGASGPYPPGVRPIGEFPPGVQPIGEYPGPYQPGRPDGRPAAPPPESPYPTGRYSAGRQASGQFASPGSPADPHAPDPYTPAPYAPDSSPDPYAPPPYSRDPYASGGPYGTGASGSDQYGSDQYGSDQYGSDQYGSGRYRADSYGSDQYGSDQYGDDPYGSEPSEPNGPYEARPPHDGEHQEPPGGRHRR